MEINDIGKFVTIFYNLRALDKEVSSREYPEVDDDRFFLQDIMNTYANLLENMMNYQIKQLRRDCFDACRLMFDEKIKTMNEEKSMNNEKSQ